MSSDGNNDWVGGEKQDRREQVSMPRLQPGGRGRVLLPKKGRGKGLSLSFRGLPRKKRDYGGS